MENINNIRYIIKRDGRKMEYQESKIYSALWKCFNDVNPTKIDLEKIKHITNMVDYKLSSNQRYGHMPTVEEIQDVVENTLIEFGCINYAKEYIKYRNHRTSIREGKIKLLDIVGDIVKESNRDNANVGNSPSAKLLQIAEAASKQYYIERLIPKEDSKLHLDGDIYINDIAWYGKTLTCIHIPLGKLLRKGFSNGRGYIRPPKSIKSAGALAAIILQSAQNDCHGGVSFGYFDRDMSRYVEKEFIRQERIIRNLSQELGIEPDLHEIERLAYDVVKEEVWQTMEGFIYNLNTMQSRAGAQIPFSSINLGTDTSRDGRMITKCLLEAYRKGLGKGESPIFPNVCFKLKAGVNFNPGDPNYDLFRQAMEVACYRLQPNFSFQDSSFNRIFENEDVNTMGCVHGTEVITYRIEDQLYVESFERAYLRVLQLNKELIYESSKYIDVENKNMTIFDSSKNDFVGIKKFIKNPNKNNWYKINFRGGRNIIATSDHPFPVVNKGRTLLDNLSIGDKIPLVYNQYSEETNVISLKTAWVLGILISEKIYKDDIDEFLEKNKYDKAMIYGIRKILFDHKYGSNSFIQEMFKGSEDVKLAFMAGAIDMAGYVNHTSTSPIAFILSSERSLAIQYMLLAQSLGYKAKFYDTLKDDKLKCKYYIEFTIDSRLMQYIKCKDKDDSMYKNININQDIISSEFGEIISIEKIDCNEHSYDVETESDRFDVSGIQSHNCRTRVISNCNGPAVSDGRGNLSFTTISLPRIALKSKGDLSEFWRLLEETVNNSIRILHNRYKIQSKMLVKDMPFLMGEKLYIGSEDLKPSDTIEQAIQHGSLSTGFVGLAECLFALLGKHHGESSDANDLGFKIISRMRELCDEAVKKYKLNFSLLASPAESTAGRLMNIDKKEFGVITGVTDKEWYTNSFHVPVEYKITSFDKIKIEGIYHKLCNAGHIGYIELPEAPYNNIDAFEKIIRHMADCDFGYGAINFPVDICKDCGFNGIIKTNNCQKCDSENITRIRRITGYLSTLEQFNESKKAETRSRLAHE